MIDGVAYDDRQGRDDARFPVTIDSTSGESGSMVMMMSVSFAKAAGVSDTVAPASFNSEAAALDERMKRG